MAGGFAQGLDAYFKLLKWLCIFAVLVTPLVIYNLYELVMWLVHHVSIQP